MSQVNCNLTDHHFR